LLKGGMERRAASRLVTVFLNSVDGQAMKESHGGDLVSAMEKGVLDKMMYSYLRRGGSSSHFVNLNGMKVLVNGISDVDEDVKARMNEWFDGVHHLSFSKLTSEQADNDEEDGFEEVFDDGGFYGEAVSNGVSAISEKMWYDARVDLFRWSADKKILEERLKTKDAQNAMEKAQLTCEHVKESSAKDIAMEKEKAEKEKEKAEKEKALLENEHLKEKAAYEARVKELELANLRMQLEREKTGNSAMGEGGRSSGGNTSRKRAQESALETEDDEGEEVEHLPRAEAVNVVLPFAGGNPQIHWLVVYEGEVEVTFDKFQSKLPLLSKFCSVRFNERWFALLSMEKRIRGNPVMKAMLAMGIAGRVWVEAFAGCKTWVGIDIPECNAHSHSSEHIVKYMEKKQRAPAQFAMVVVK
jgi:hypothetical protein